ncbi:MAG: prephenate dehydrogenase/arogenate dehydrogenase family protein [Patescibacteria group bacterium]
MKKVIGVIGGKGIMGSFFAEYFKKIGHEVFISDQKTELTNKELIEKSDVVIFSVPLHLTEKIIRQCMKWTRKSQILMDVTSLKVRPIKEMMKSPAEVIGLHPMFRAGKNGLQNQVVVMCPGRAQKKTIKEVHQWFTQGGAKIVEMKAKEHDQLMSVIQVLLHFHTIVLGNTLEKLKIPLKKTLEIASPIYRLEMDMIGRLFSQDPLLYAAIEMLNPENKKVIHTLEKETKKLSKIITKKNFTSFTKSFQKTSQFFGSFKDEAMKKIDEMLKKRL